jgi:hypothetical protein
MADNQAIAAIQALASPKSTAAIDGAQMLAVAMVAGEDLLRKVMQKHPYAVIGGGLALGALAGLFPLVGSNSHERRSYD